MFKALFGLEDDIALQYSRIVEVRQDCKRLAETVLRGKKRNILRIVFLQRTNCPSWDEVAEEYEPYISAIKEYIGKLSIR